MSAAAATAARAALRRPRPACLEVSAEAAARIRALVARRTPRPAGVRVGVRTRGCNGMSYTLDYAAAPAKFDERVELPLPPPTPPPPPLAHPRHDGAAGDAAASVQDEPAPCSRDDDRNVAQPSVFVDPRALIHIVGTRMHFVDNDLVSEFVFENPNAKGTCGCGESFNV
jgi:iron-sulfur cluster assembly accessory protein